MSFPRYESYKDSGVEWLGEVPEHWEVIRSRRMFAQRKDKALDMDQQLTASQKYGVIYQADFMALEGQKVVQVIHGADILKHVEPNDFVISMRSFQGGIEWCGLRGSISSAYVMLIPQGNVEVGFFRYLLKSKPYIQALQSTTNLVRDGQALRYENFTLVDLPLIPKNEQANIAAFLDRETAKIDALIDEQQRLVELLKEKRQAVISHAVTKGQNPNALMKDSGIEWLGEVPKHWEICALKRIAIMKSGDSITSDSIEEEGEYPVFGGNGLRGYTQSYTHEGTYALIGRQGALCGNINYARGQFWASEHAIVVTPQQPVETFWLGELLGAMNLNQYSISAAQPGLSVEIIENLKIPLPPPSEQSAIAAFLTHEITKLDILNAEAQRATELLKERRTALISAAVTGKIDVRGLVAVQSQFEAAA